MALDTLGDAASAVIRRSSGMPLGLGATTHGCRPISVKIQPVALARNGVAMTAMDPTRSQRLSVGSSRPRRVFHQATTAPNEAMAPKPIIDRKPQYVMTRLGR